MRIILFLFILANLISCDDGDFEVPSFEFDTTVNTCGTYVLYRTNSNQTEALIIQLNEEEISQEEGAVAIAITTNNCNYRIFDDRIGADYFCSDVPPVQPIVVKNWTAMAGENNFITIDSSVLYDEDGITIIGYNHQIILNNLVLESEGESIIIESYDYGSFNTYL